MATARTSASAPGATFLVSPQLNPEMIRVANRYQVATISGASTPTEILESTEAGADIVKLGDYLALPNVGAVRGSCITPGKALAEQNWRRVGMLARDARRRAEAS